MEGIEGRKRRPYLMAVLCFSAEWALYYLFEFVMGRIGGGDSPLLNLIPLPLAILFALLAVRLTGGGGSLPAWWKRLVAAAVLVALDQGMKLLVGAGQGQGTVIVPGWLSIDPGFNEAGSWGFSRFGIDAPLWVSAVLKIAAVLALIEGYRFARKSGKPSAMLGLAGLLFAAGSAASIADSLFWGMTLDVFKIQGLFIFDLKDLYLALGAGSFLSWLLTEYSFGELVAGSGKLKFRDFAKGELRAFAGMFRGKKRGRNRR